MKMMYYDDCDATWFFTKEFYLQRGIANILLNEMDISTSNQKAYRRIESTLIHFDAAFRDSFYHAESFDLHSALSEVVEAFSLFLSNSTNTLVSFSGQDMMIVKSQIVKRFFQLVNDAMDDDKIECTNKDGLDNCFPISSLMLLHDLRQQIRHKTSNTLAGFVCFSITWLTWY